MYNRYRPSTFAAVVGQEHVTDALQAALANGRVHHAYLFSGPRGCGKTSSARILAASLNCIHGPTPSPCGECEHCTSIRAGSSMDVIEIDAASHGGVDDARDLRERAVFTPASARFKVYIIDEAHQVTKDAFNALLKLVEEPPPHLKFVFATTEPDKVLQTIRSRTHHYAFRLVPPGILRDHLAWICEQEGVQVDPQVLPLVVRAGAGSVRDSLSVLDQLIAGAGTDGLTRERAAALLGLTDGVLLDDTVEALGARDGATLFSVVERVVSSGHDPRRFAADLLERLRDVLVLDAVPDAPERGLLPLYAPDQLDRMRQQAAHMGAAELSRSADILHAGLLEMRGTTSPRLLLELVLARALLPAAATDESALLVRLERLERRLAAGAVAPAPAPEAHAAPAPQPPAQAPQPAPATPQQPARPAAGPAPAPAPKPTPTPAAPASPAPASPEPAPSGSIDAAGLRRVWDEVLRAVSRRRRVTHALLVTAEVAEVKGNELVLHFSAPPLARNFERSPVEETVLREALAEVVGGSWKVSTKSSTPPAPGKPGKRPAPPPPEEPTAEDMAGDDGGTPVEPVDPVALLRSGLGAQVIDERDAG